MRISKPSLTTLILEKYVDLLTQYLILVSQSNLNQEFKIINNGINTIHRVFSYVFTKTQSLEKTIYYAQKSSYYYLEYMEQITQTNFGFNSLNQIDAILFVYNKTIFDLYDDENNTFNTMTNIMIINEEPLPGYDVDLSILFPLISRSIHLVLFWDNADLSNADRVDICKMFLLKWLNQPNIDIANSFLEIIQQNIIQSREPKTYRQLLHEFINRPLQSLSTNQKKTNIINKDINDLHLIKYYNDNTEFNKQFNHNIKDFVHWLYV